MESKIVELKAKNIADKIYPEVKHNNVTNENFKSYHYGFRQGYLKAYFDLEQLIETVEFMIREKDEGRDINIYSDELESALNKFKL